jgi:small neutral amino acid transporter SnatA (MarC family)
MVVRTFLAAEAALFGTAALMHAGIILHGYEHTRARNAESVITLVLISSLLWSALAPARVRAVGLGAQGFALLGTLVGIFTMIMAWDRDPRSTSCCMRRW